MLKIWGRASSLNVQKAMWTVGELGIVFPSSAHWIEAAFLLQTLSAEGGIHQE